jgi:hypothetical protein
MDKRARLLLGVVVLSVVVLGCGLLPTSTPSPEAPTGSPTPQAPTPSPTPEAPTPSATPEETALPTSSPTAMETPEDSSPTPTPSPEAAQEPVIDWVRGYPSPADPGDTITLEWQSSGATRASLCHLLPSYQYETCWQVQPTDSMTYTVPVTSRNAENFVLQVYDAAEQRAQATIVVALTCPDTWFFAGAPDGCPSSPAITGDGAEQHFEHGLMLWSGAEDRIYVLFEETGSSSAWRICQDEWDEGDLESDPSLVPPSGLYQPRRGFGLVWREEPGVRDSLGWATEQEVAFTISVQRTSFWKYNTTYISAVDGGVWELEPEASGWHHIP